MLNVFRRSACLAELIESLSLRLIDVGARGGMDADLYPAAWAVHATGFEPAAEECVRLNQLPAYPWRSVCFVPTAIGGMDQTSTLRIPGNSIGASLLPQNSLMLDRFGHASLHKTRTEMSVETLTLDSACKRFNLAAPDYLKIDVEGAELSILRSAPKVLSSCSAIKVEVSFLEQRIEQPLMHEVVDYMLKSGFILADIRDLHSWRRRPLPAHPYIADWLVPYSRGVLAQCDLLFLRDPRRLETDTSLLRLAIISSILGFFDHAVEALRESPDLVPSLQEKYNHLFIHDFARVSRIMGRKAVISQFIYYLRHLIPLAKSLTIGISTSTPVMPGY